MPPCSQGVTTGRFIAATAIRNKNVMRASTATQLPLFQPDSDWTPPEILPEPSGFSKAAIDIETYDPDLMKKGPGWPWKHGYIVGISVATDAWPAVYLPIKHQGGNNLDRTMVYEWLQELLSRPASFVMHNAMYDVGWLTVEGLRMPGTIHDTMLAAALLDENRMSYSLDSLGKTYCHAQKDESLLREASAAWGVKAKEGMWRLPSQFVGPYAEQDAALTLQLWDKLAPLLKEYGLWELYQTEVGLLPLVIQMRRRGVRVSEERAEQVKAIMAEKEQHLLDDIRQRVSWKGPIDLWAAKSLSGVFDAVGVEYNRTPTGLPSFQSNWLESHPHWLPKLVVRARKYQRSSSTFIDQYILGHSVNGRLHAEMHPLRSDEGGTVSGRFAFSNPPLQQMPARDPELGPLIRSIFLPEDGCLWGAFDYSQQEPRLTVHYAALMGLPGAEDAVTYYTDNPDADFHKMVAEMAGIERKDAKVINLGLAYGMGKQKLAASLQLDIAAAEVLFEQYHERVPFIRGLTEACSNRAASIGFIRTILGRRCRFDRWEPADRKKDERIVAVEQWKARKSWPNRPLRRAFTHKAMNRLIQGSAADQTKKAMLDLYNEGIIPMLQMHDELDISTETAVQARRIVEIMRDAIPIKVPMKVDCELGTNWGEANKSITDVWPD